jgi:uncharacterized membrane protein (DUF106 family)
MDVSVIPIATLFMFSLAAGISLLTSLTNRLLTNPKQSKEWRQEIAEWNVDFRKAQKEGDKKLLDKVMKKQKHIMQLQSKMMWQQMKVTLIFIVPLILIWQFLGGFFTKTGVGPVPIAYFPGLGPNLPLPVFSISFIWWYLLSSMFFGTVFSHLFGLIEVAE